MTEVASASVYRGSRKHVLDWTGRPEFVPELFNLIRPVPCSATSASRWKPRGYEAVEEARLETFGPEAMPNSGAWRDLRTWWLAHERGANSPNWDIALSCEVEGRPGLVLVEAKANVPELGAWGKSAAREGSDGSVANHERIGAAIDDACATLRQLGVETAISRDTHYQLSNRVAFAWKLASLGIPTVLVYLGFLGDEGIRDAGEPFADDADWRRVFADYTRGIVPETAFERRIDCGGAPMWMLVRSRLVLEQSPPRPMRPADSQAYT